MVLDVDPIKRRISLGIKQCSENPWDEFHELHPEGSEVQGEIKSITEFGIFIGLTDDIDGMVHLSDLDWKQPGEEVIGQYSKGDVVRARVLGIDIEKDRVSLGVKQLSPDPFTGMDKFKKGDTVTCTVTEIATGGLEVSFEEDLRGFIRKADLSRERSEQRPERFAVGDKVDATIMSIDRETRRVTLSGKALEIADETDAMAQYGSSDSGASLGDILGAAISRAREAEASQSEVGNEEADTSAASGDVAPNEDTEPGDDAAAANSEEVEAEPEPTATDTAVVDTQEPDAESEEEPESKN